MITQTSKRIATAFTAIRRGKFTKAATALGMSKPPKRVRVTRNGRSIRANVNGNQITDSNGKILTGDIKFSDTDTSANWLAYRYGWIPLLSDIHGSLTTAYDYSRSENFKMSTFRGSAKDTLTESVNGVSFTVPSTVNYPSIKANCSVVIERSVRFKVKALLESSAASRSAQLGVSNPLLVAWELVPYSFVADWFINVSDVIEGLTAFNGFTFKSGVEIIDIKNSIFTGTCAYVRSGSWNIQSSVGNNTPSIFEYHSYKREVLSDFPTVSLYCAMNPFANKVNRMIDAVSLVHQLFRR